MIGILGAGSWGTALGMLVANNHPEKQIPIWGHDPTHLAAIRAQGKNQRYLPDIKLPENLNFIDSLEDLTNLAKDLLIVVPSHAFREVLEKLKPYVSRHHRLIIATKGLEINTGRFLDEVVAEVLGETIRYCAVLSGPSFAREVAQGSPTAVSIATKDQKFGRDLLRYFHCKSFRVYLNPDLRGVQLGGVMKNLLAVAAGIADGLNCGSNARAALITRGLAEMVRLGKAVGAKQSTLLGLSGLGDLILCTTDMQSRNKRLGFALAQGKTVSEAQREIGQAVEAINNVSAVCNISRLHEVELPIIEQVDLILKQKISPKAAVDCLLSRAPAREYL